MTSPVSSSEPETAPARRWVIALLAVLGLVALIVRLPAIFLLPNHDGDAYCYIEKAVQLRGAFLSGNFHFASLFFFWLPLYPLLIALASLLLPGVSIMLVGKLIAAAAGLAVCLLVYRLLILLTHRPLVAAAGTLLVALDPWQVLYSSNTMTEVPFEALVLGALERTLHRRWTTAACLLAAAGLIRIEAWPLAALVPLAAFALERRVRVPVVVAVFAAPLFWAAVNLAATDDAFAFFRVRDGYVAAYLAAEPARAHLARALLFTDWYNFVRGANFVLTAGAFAALAQLAVILWSRCGAGGVRQETAAALAAGTVYLFLLGFLVLAYLTHSQPVIWVRYGLIYQPLGVCLTLWFLAGATRPHRGRLALLVLLACSGAQLTQQWQSVRAAGENLVWYRRAAARLAVMAPACTYCDSPTVRVESGLARTAMRDHTQVQGTDRAAFLADLHRQGVDCLVFVPGAGSTPARLFPELSAYRSVGSFEPVARFAPAPSDWRMPVLIYRFNPADARLAAGGDFGPAR